MAERFQEFLDWTIWEVLVLIVLVIGLSRIIMLLSHMKDMLFDIWLIKKGLDKLPHD